MCSYAEMDETFYSYIYKRVLALFSVHSAYISVCKWKSASIIHNIMNLIFLPSKTKIAIKYVSNGLCMHVVSYCFAGFMLVKQLHLYLPTPYMFV